MEGMESAGSVTPDTASSDTASGVTDESNGSADSQGSGGTKAARQGKETLTKAQIRELADGDMDALVTLKVNGEARKVPLKEALKLAQLEQASHAKMQEAAQYKKQAQALTEYAKKDPRGFLRQVGLDPYEFAEMTLAEKLEELSLSPEQKRLRELEQYKAQNDKIEAERKAEIERQAASQAEAKAMETMDKEITEAFQASGLPKHPFYVQQIAAVMLQAEKQGRDLSAKDAAGIVKGRFDTQIKEVFGNLDAEAIRGFLGDTVLKKLREADVKRVTEKSAPTVNSAVSRPGQSSQAKSTAPKQPMSEKEWRQWVESHKQ